MAEARLDANLGAGLSDAGSGGAVLSAHEPHASDFIALLKPRVMSLVVFTGLVGMVVAPGAIHPVIGITALLCIAIGAGASGAINMWFDADIDARMDRTSGRPIPQGRITPDQALGFGATLAVGSIATMELLVNAAAAVLLAITIGYYVFIYTMWLKRRTPQNIVIGGAAGAFPPMIGWAAVTGDVSLYPILLFAIIFFWTPPHFWALALYRSDDYARVGVPMLPVVAGLEETRKQILLYTIILVPLALTPWLLGFTGMLYGVGALVLGAAFSWFAVQVWRKRDVPSAKKLFGFSILYLFLIFALLAADAMLGLVRLAQGVA